MSVNIVINQTADIIRSTVRKIAEIIAPTYGPAGKKVIISKVTHGFVLDDGVQIARDLEMNDANENAVLKVVREVAIRTNDRVGDGTTGAIIMLDAIMQEVGRLSNPNGRLIEAGLKKGFEEAKEQLLSTAKTVKTKEDLFKVAKISFDNDKIAEIIADTWHKIGKEGMVTVDRSGSMDTISDIAEGIQLDRGYISPYMIFNPARMESVIDKPYILVTDYRLTEVNDILVAMDILAQKKILQLVIICDNLEGNALATAVVNKMQNKFAVVAINKPSGETALEDIALLTGAKMFSEKKGDKLEEITEKDFGRADRFICRQKESVIVGPRGNKVIVAKAINDLKEAATNATTDKEKENTKKRLAFFLNKIAVIKVGAPTENEVKALQYKVEDAVNATRAAFRSGVVCGGGIGLSRLETSSQILNDALKAPYRQLRINMAMDTAPALKDDEAINVVTGETGNFLKVGVVDPVEVLIAQVESAVSIAGLLITTHGMVVEPPKHFKQEEE